MPTLRIRVGESSWLCRRANRMNGAHGVSEGLLRTSALESQPRKYHRGVDLTSDVLPFGRPWYDTLDNANGLHETLQPLSRCCGSHL